MTEVAVHMLCGVAVLVQALLALYFLLALALAHMEPKLWVVPLTCLAAVFVFSVLYSLCSALWPFFRLATWIS